MLTVNIIGAGRVGQALGLALASKQLAIIKGVCNQSLGSAQRAVQYIGAGLACSELNALPQAQLTIISCNDDAIAQMVTALSTLSFKKKSIFLHCSGALSSDILAPLTQKNALIASVHPLRAFTNISSSEAFHDCFCTIEGDAQAKVILRPLFQSLGAIVTEVNKDKKLQYHAAAVMASNYLITLAHCSNQLFEDANITPELAKSMTQDLMQRSLDNLQDKTFKSALTGPLQRGDIQCITQHLEALRAFPNINALYRSAALNTLQITDLDSTKVGALCKLLQEDSAISANK